MWPPLAAVHTSTDQCACGHNQRLCTRQRTLKPSWYDDIRAAVRTTETCAYCRRAAAVRTPIRGPIWTHVHATHAAHAAADAVQWHLLSSSAHNADYQCCCVGGCIGARQQLWRMSHSSLVMMLHLSPCIGYQEYAHRNPAQPCHSHSPRAKRIANITTVFPPQEERIRRRFQETSVSQNMPIPKKATSEKLCSTVQQEYNTSVACCRSLHTSQ